MKTRATIAMTLVVLAIVGLAAAPPAAQADVLYVEGFVDSLGQSNPYWGTYGGHTGIKVNQSDTGWAPYGGGPYSAVVSDQWGDTAPSPDGDNWHFFGFNDSNCGLLYSVPGEVLIAAADRLQTQFSAHLAKTDSNGLRWMAQVDGGAWYFTDEFFHSPHGSVNDSGSVSEWQYEVLDVEATNAWRLWTDTGDNNPMNGGWDSYNEELTGYLGSAQALPAGDITGVGIFVKKNNNANRVAVDNFAITKTGSEPTGLLLLLSGVIGILPVRRKR